jgi:hypothetical protein
MWIKEPSATIGQSMHDNVNLLYNENKIYIMDNHLAASWCWLQKVDIADSHYYLHIDRHYDLLGSNNIIQTHLIDKGVKLHELSFPEYLDLKQLGSNNATFKLFRWDNYVLNLHYAYPTLFNEAYFATHKDGTLHEGFVTREVDFLELLLEIDYWIEERQDKGWILNLDLDYFYGHVNDKKIQIIDDQYIEQLAINIRKIISKVKVFTICLSPECCGGWQNAIEKAEIICNVLKIDFVERLREKLRTTHVSRHFG